MTSYTLFLEKPKSKKLTLHIALICIGIFWLIKGDYLIAVLLFIFAITGFYTNRKLAVTFNDEKIIYPAFFNESYLWEEVENVVLKDDILTIDLKNNKLLQSAITPDSAINIDEQKFNEFCKLRLKIKS